MLRETIAIIALLAATVASQAQNETTLLCTGTAKRLLKQSGTVQYEKSKPFTASLIVVPNVTINWQGDPADSVFWWTDPVSFHWHRLFKQEKGEHYLSYSGWIDRVTGRAHIHHDAIETDSDKTETVDYDLLCKPAKPLF
jgi:hypothetical protein